MKNVSAGLVVALLLALVVGVGLIQALSNFTGGIELRPAAPALQTTATISVSAPKNVNSSTNTFEVDVNITDVNNANGLGAWEMELNFDGGIIEGQAGAHDPWLSNRGKRDIVKLPPSAPWLVAENGLVAMGAATCPVPDCGGGLEQQKTETGPTGEGRLATVTFHVKGRGVTSLSFNDQKTQITDTQAQVLGLNTTLTTIGVFPYSLVRGSSAKFNMIALAVAMPGLNTAQDLADYVGGAQLVMKWDATGQKFDPYVPGTPTFPNFGLQVGHVYFLALDNSVLENSVLFANTVTPGVKFNLVRDTSCKFNFISIPVEKDGVINNAQELADDVLGAQLVMKWDAVGQKFDPYVPGTPTFPNFDLKVGDPVVVCLDNTAGSNIWP